MKTLSQPLLRVIAKIQGYRRRNGDLRSVAGGLAILAAFLVLGHALIDSGGFRVRVNRATEVAFTEARKIILSDADDAITAEIDNGWLFITAPGEAERAARIPLRAEGVVSELVREAAIPLRENGARANPVSVAVGFGMIVLLIIVGRQMMMMTGLGRSIGSALAVEDIRTRFADVAGAEEAKRDLAELAGLIRGDINFEATGARIPKGVLLCGPPGTGKTLLARATAGEAGVNFIAATGSDFGGMLVG